MASRHGSGRATNIKPQRPQSRYQVENQMIRKREKEFKHDQLWGGQQRYYEKWEKQNAKFEEWTSPRYHEENNKLIQKIKTKREKDELLEKRREKLRKLMQEEDKLYQVEVMMYKTRNYAASVALKEDISTDILKDLNKTLKLEEEDRRKHEAELKLYHQWRNNNPTLRRHERQYRCRDLKLSWLDQQIENRMKKEKEEEECRKMLRERDARLKKANQEDLEEKKQIEAKRYALKKDLEEQIEVLKVKNALSEELKKKESECMKSKAELERLEDLRLEEYRRRMNKETALHNIKQYKLKLKNKATDMQENLEREVLLIKELKKLDLIDRIADEAKKEELKEVLIQFGEMAREQKRLEEHRKKHLELVFDSEAKFMFEKQDEIWRQEEAARLDLIRDVFQTVREQVEENLKKNMDKQRMVIEEREEILKRIEDYNRELEEANKKEVKTRAVRRHELDEEVRLKELLKKQERGRELKNINEELERVRKEEERLKKEILEMQTRQGPLRRARSRIFM